MGPAWLPEHAMLTESQLAQNRAEPVLPMTALMHKTAAELPDETSGGNVVETLRVPHITVHAYGDTPEMIGTMEKAVADRRMSRAHATVHPGGIAAAIDSYRNAVSPNLVLIESRAAGAELDAQLDALANVCQSGTKVILIGYANDISVYRNLLARGVSEYVVAPVDPISLIAAIANLYRDAGASKLGRSFAFIGAKGGVGSSTIAHNVASTMARTYGRKVILADLDLPFGSASIGFNLDPAKGIAEAVGEPSRLDDALLEHLLRKCEDHLSVLTAPATLVQCYDMEEGAFEPLISLAQSNVPFVVLDVPHIWTSWVKRTVVAADEVVITAVPDLVSLRNVKNLVELLKRERPNDAPPKLVLNQVGMPKRSEIKPDKFAAAIQLEPIACIPFEPSSLSTAANSSRMIADVAAKSAVSLSFPKIVQAITGFTSPSRKSRFAFRRRA
jgi:pilus assembly protein CpaE